MLYLHCLKFKIVTNLQKTYNIKGKNDQIHGYSNNRSIYELVLIIELFLAKITITVEQDNEI